MTVNLASILARAAQVTEGDTLAAELAQDITALADEIRDLGDRIDVYRGRIDVLTAERDQARGEA